MAELVWAPRHPLPPKRLHGSHLVDPCSWWALGFSLVSRMDNVALRKVHFILQIWIQLHSVLTCIIFTDILCICVLQFLGDNDKAYGFSKEKSSVGKSVTSLGYTCGGQKLKVKDTEKSIIIIIK